MPRGKLVELVEFAEQLQTEFGFPVASFGHAGDGNIHVNIMVPTMDERGIAKARWHPHAVPDAARAMHTAMKKALGPNGIPNPGKCMMNLSLLSVPVGEKAIGEERMGTKT